MDIKRKDGDISDRSEGKRVLVYPDGRTALSTGGATLTVNGQSHSEEIEVKGLSDPDVQKLVVNPRNKTVLAKIDRIKESNKDIDRKLSKI